MTRTQAYEWLAARMRIPKPVCHIASFDVKTCESVRRESLEWLRRHGKDVTNVCGDNAA